LPKPQPLKQESISCEEISDSHRSIHIIIKSEKKNVLSKLNQKKSLKDRLNESEEFKSQMFAASIQNFDSVSLNSLEFDEAN